MTLAAGQIVSNSGGAVSATMTSGGTLTNQHLGLFTRGSVSGVAFEDIDGNDSYDPLVDNPFASLTVKAFKDANNNNLPDASETQLSVSTSGRPTRSFSLRTT